MRIDPNLSEFSPPGEEFTRPPEVSETLSDHSRYPAGFSAQRPEADASSFAEEEASGEETASQSKAANRQAARKHSLLLQFAAVASSVVLVTNSFGLDFLGLDGFFNDSVITGRIEESYEEPSSPVPEHMPGFPVGGDEALPRLQPADLKDDYYSDHPHHSYIVTAYFEPVAGFGDKANITGYIYADSFDDNEFLFPESVYWWYADNAPERLTEDDSIRYDRASNTLTLSGYKGQGLLIADMGNDLKIRLEGDNVLSQSLRIGAGSVTITGSGSLTVNADMTEDYGILLEASFCEAALLIDSAASVDIRGKMCAVYASKTCAEKMVWLNSRAALSAVRQVMNAWEDLPPKDSAAHYYTWYLIDPQTQTMATRLQYGSGTVSVPVTEPETETAAPVPLTVSLPVGGDSAFPILPNPLPGSTGADGQLHESSILMWEDYSAEGGLSNSLNIYSYHQDHPTGRSDIYYDPSENVLTLNNYTGGRLIVRNMGSSFRIRLIGKCELFCGIEALGDLTSGSITFTGDGYLALNSAGGSVYGIYLDAGEAEACIMIESSVVMDIYGQNVIRAANTSASKPIYYLSDAPLSGLLQVSDLGEKGIQAEGTFYDWHVADMRGDAVSHIHFGGEVPPDPTQEDLPGLPVGGDAGYPVLENPEPNSPVPGYGILYEDYIQVFDRLSDSWEFIYLNSAPSEYLVTQPGISYDRGTNTLTLNNYHGAGISANLLGNGFTVELIGENELTQDFMVWGFYTGGSVHFTGSGSLAINTSLTQDTGLFLIGEYSPSCLMIDKETVLEVNGAEAAVVLAASSADKMVYYLSDRPLDGVRQVNIGEESNDNPYVEGSFFSWTLIDENGEVLTHVRFAADEIPT